MAVEKAKNVPPFVLWCTATIPTAFDDSMSYYEALCALNKFIQENIIDVVNNNATIIEEAVKEIAALKKYIDEYFDNLDVQEEINNKLDEMAEGGQLVEIIGAYLSLQSVIGYDTVADMSASENLIAGSFAKTYGESTIGDGLGCFYKIKTLTESDVIDGKNKVAVGDSLYAERIISSVIIFDTFEDAVDFALPQGTTFKTKGFYAVDDGGAATYVVSDSSTNTVPYGSTLYADPLKNPNVLVYGFYNDGTSSTSLLSRIAGLKKIYFPAGEYLISTLSIHNQNDIEVYGDGDNSIIKCESTGLTSVNLLDFMICKNLHVHHLHLDAMKVYGSTTVSFINCLNVEIDHCYITGNTNQRTLNVMTAGEGQIPDTYRRKYYIHDNEVTNYGTVRDGALIECTGHGIRDDQDQLTMYYLYDVIIENNYLHIGEVNYQSSNEDLHDCIEIDNAYNTIIKNNRCETRLHKCISMDTRCIDFIIDGNYCSYGEPRDHGIGIEVTGANIYNTRGVITKNTVRYIATGIVIGSPHVVVTNNNVYDCGTRCITCANTECQNCLIANNDLFDSTEGINIAGEPSNIIIAHNQTNGMTNNDIVVQSGTGAGIKITHDQFNKVDINDGISRISNINGVFIERTPVFRGSLYMTSGNLHFINNSGTDFTIATS